MPKKGAVALTETVPSQRRPSFIMGNQSFLGFLQSFLGETTGGDNDYSKVSRGQQLGDKNPKKPRIF